MKLKQYKIIYVLFILLFSNTVFADTFSFRWDPNQESDLAGYRLYASDTSGQYTYGEENAYDIVILTRENGEITDHPTQTQVYTIDTPGTYYFVLTAYDTENLESDPSIEQVLVVEGMSQPRELRFEFIQN